MASAASDSIWTITDWAYRWGEPGADLETAPRWPEADSAWLPPAIPYQQGTFEADVLWLRTRLPARLPEQAVLVLPIVLLDVEAYVDTVLVFSAREVSPYAGTRYASVISYLVPLPADASGEWLYLRVHSIAAQHIGLRNHAYVGTTFAALRQAWLETAGEFAIGFLCVAAGLVALLLLPTLRRRDEVLLFGSFALLALTVGSNYLTDSILVRIVLPFPVALYYASFSIIFFPVGLLGFFEQSIDGGPKHIVRWMVWTHLGFALVIFGLDVAGLAAIPEYFLPFFGLLAVSLIVISIVAVVAIRRGQYEARVFGGIVLFVMLLGMHDTLFLGLGLNPDRPSVSPYGFLVLLITLGYLIQYRFQERTRQLEIKTAELTEMNATLEDRVAERTEALQTSLSHLQTTQAQLVQSEKMASLGQLTAGIAHEIKNPLNFINNFAALSRELADDLKEETDPEEIQLLLDDIQSNATKIEEHGKRADGIVRSMMQHASKGTGQREQVDLNKLVDEHVDLARHSKRAQQAGFEVHVVRTYAEGLGSVDIVPREIGRVVLNLLANAFDAVIEQDRQAKGSYVPTVKVSTQRVNDQVEIRVADNGPGMPADVKAKIFEPFFTTKPTGQGTGLGLSLSYDIVTQGHGGTLEVESKPGKGAMFVVRIPC